VFDYSYPYIISDAVQTNGLLGYTQAVLKIYIYIYTHTHTHEYIYTHTHIFARMSCISAGVNMK